MKKIEKFADNKVLNLNLCVGGTVYVTCGEGSENCSDEAGCFIDGEYDDIVEDGTDCGGLVAAPLNPILVNSAAQFVRNYSF